MSVAGFEMLTLPIQQVEAVVPLRKLPQCAHLSVNLTALI